MSKDQEEVDNWIEFMTHMSDTSDKEIIFKKEELLEIAYSIKDVLTSLKFMYNKLPEDVSTKLHSSVQKLLSKAEG